MKKACGPIALLGSGETSLAGGRVFETIARRFPQPLRIAILETPAGFELNSARVAGHVADFIQERLQNFNPHIDIVPARKRDTSFSPDNPQILQPLLQANIVFMGPGSPTYAVHQLKGSLAWDLVRARHRLGAALVFASAAVIAVGACSLPVYEIYKVGEDVSLVLGLDLFADVNLLLSIIPHWNNTDGGDEVDTSRCFIGLERFNQWCKLLPSGHTTIGLDEHTGIILDFDTGKCTVSGVSSVTLLRSNNSDIFPAGAEFPISELGDYTMRENLKTGISDRALEMVKSAEQIERAEELPAELVYLAEERQQARLRQDWVTADIFRQKMALLGWLVKDTPEGQKIVRQP
jgi:cyanophycinase-like exopeptidase